MSVRAFLATFCIVVGSDDSKVNVPGCRGPGGAGDLGVVDELDQIAAFRFSFLKAGEI